MVKSAAIMLSAILFCAGCSGSQKGEKHLRLETAAPDFQVPDQNGQVVRLSDLHQNGPLVLTFLRSFF